MRHLSDTLIQYRAWNVGRRGGVPGFALTRVLLGDDDPSERQQGREAHAEADAHEDLEAVLGRRDRRGVRGQGARQAHAYDLKQGTGEDEVEGRDLHVRSEERGQRRGEGGREHERKEREARVDWAEPVDRLCPLWDVDDDRDEGEADAERVSVVLTTQAARLERRSREAERVGEKGTAIVVAYASIAASSLFFKRLGGNTGSWTTDGLSM